MANNKAFKVKNGISATRYLLSGGVETAGSEGYSLANASYDNVSFSITSQDDQPFGITFKPDGTKMYLVGNTNDRVFQYTLSTAWDLSTASYDSVSFLVSSQDGNPMRVSFNDDGTKMYLVGQLTDSLYQYSLSTAYDISTASYDSVSFSVNAQDGLVYNVAFNPDGTKMFMLGDATDSAYQYSLSTAYDLSTASYDSVSFSFASQNTTCTGFTFSDDGTKLFLSGASPDGIFQYTLSTPFDLSTVSYSNISFDGSAQDGAAFSVEFSSDGTKMYFLGRTNDTVYQYSTIAYTQTLDLSTGTTFSFTPSGATTVSFTNPPASGLACAFTVEINGDGSTITWPASVKWPSGTAPTATATKELYAFITTDGGTTYYGKQAATELA